MDVEFLPCPEVPYEPVREVWSDAVTGAYSFEKIAAGTYFVISFDHTGVFGAVAESDVVRPEPTP
jgi:hypothetical protein